MQAVIMAGGKGTRLSKITHDKIPKPMVDIAGRPLLEWQVDVLKRYGISDVIFIIGHLGHVIREYFGDGSRFGITASYIEEESPLGTAGGFYRLSTYLKDEYFFLVFGDVLFDIDIDRMESFHREKHSIATLLVHPNSHPFDSDLIIHDETGRVTGFDSKENVRDYCYCNCVNSGIYILSKGICNYVEKDGMKIDLEKDILMKLVENQSEVYAYTSPEYVRDIGTVDRIIAAERDAVNGIIFNKNLSNKQACVFLDRDGTINKYRGLISRQDELELEAFVDSAIKKINCSDMLAVVVTNQPVVARGMCSIEDVYSLHNKMECMLGEKGAYVDDIFFCPHHPDKGYPEENPIYKISCSCRKPDIGMLLDAAKKYNIDFAKSWIVGDTSTDIKTGVNAGIKTVLVETGEAGLDGKYDVEPDYRAKNLLDAVNLILEVHNNGL